MSSKKRNGTIDFFRFIFSMTIVLFHSNKFAVDLEHTWFPRGTLGVEFFFIVSGFLLGMSLISNPEEKTGSELCKDTYMYIGRKIKGIFPDYGVAFIVAFIAMSYYWRPKSLLALVSMFAKTIPEFTFLSMAGFPATAVNGVDWYLSALFLSLLILYPIARRNPKRFVYLISPVVAIFLIGRVFMNFSAINAIRIGVGKANWNYFLHPGMFRAIGEICFGTWLILPYQRIKELRFSKIGKVLYSTLEVGCYIIVLLIMYKMPGNSAGDFPLVLLLGIGIMASFAHKGILSDFMDNRLSAALGKLSLDVFLCNLFWRNLIYRYLSGKGISYPRLMLLYLALVLGTALAVRLISFGLHKSWPMIKKSCKKLLFSQP